METVNYESWKDPIRIKKDYKRVYTTKYTEKLKKLNINVDTKEFLDQAFNYYLEVQINKAQRVKNNEVKENDTINKPSQ